MAMVLVSLVMAAMIAVGVYSLLGVMRQEAARSASRTAGVVADAAHGGSDSLGGA